MFVCLLVGWMVGLWGFACVCVVVRVLPTANTAAMAILMFLRLLKLLTKLRIDAKEMEGVEFRK